MVMPVAQEYTGLTSVCFCLFYEPIHERLAVVVVYTTVALESKVYVRETSDLLKKHMLPFLLYDWFVIGHVHFLVVDLLEVVGIYLACFLQLPI